MGGGGGGSIRKIEIHKATKGNESIRFSHCFLENAFI